VLPLRRRRLGDIRPIYGSSNAERTREPTDYLLEEGHGALHNTRKQNNHRR
jgi:hypothetical protein